MDINVPEQTNDWKYTKAAVANFRRLLICSKCSNLMKDPVCLGMCEHMLCRSCAGPRAGDGCVVCQSPAWVKDIQINRHLNSIIHLFSGLESLFSPTEQSDCSPVNNDAQPECSIYKHKKNFKIWFSPRSRKVRCMVEKPSEVTLPESRYSAGTAAAQPGKSSAQLGDLSIFNFTSSSQDSAASCSQSHKNKNINRKKRSAKKNTSRRQMPVQSATRAMRKQTKDTMKKNRLEAINQQWGFTGELDSLNEKDQPCAESGRRTSKRVSFISPIVTSDDPQPEVPQDSNNDHSPDRSTVKGNLSENKTLLNEKKQSGQSISTSVMQHDRLCTRSSSDNHGKDNGSPARHSTKRRTMEDKVTTLETTPKRPRASPGKRRKSQMSPAILNPRSSASPRCNENNRNSREELGESLSVLANSSPRSPCTRASSGRRPASGSPAFLKRNHKGETPLHIASIKGDVEAVMELLDQGADPNLKDNAGWTPLHEACNLGHLAVVEVLVSRGALLNTPGYKNDSPLHDAVRNGHPAIAKLLLQQGASQNVLNLYGKRPADYASSLDMQEIFQEASGETPFVNTAHSNSPGLSMVSDCAKMEEMVFLASKLSQPEQHQLAKVGELLGGRIVETFSTSVSHIVLPEEHLPTTLSTLLGLLAGCWIVKYSWVQACLEAGKRMPEAEHEAGEGPQRSRINRCSLLPPLFDGCFFFLLGAFTSPSKDKLSKMLREGGGQLLSRQPKPDSDVTQTLSAAAYHALPGSDQALCTQYIIFDPQGPHKPAVVRRGKVWSAPSTWVINCITAFRLLPVPDPQTSD